MSGTREDTSSMVPLTGSFTSLTFDVSQQLTSIGQLSSDNAPANENKSQQLTTKTQSVKSITKKNGPDNTLKVGQNNKYHKNITKDSKSNYSDEVIDQDNSCEDVPKPDLVVGCEDNMETPKKAPEKMVNKSQQKMMHSIDLDENGPNEAETK